MSAEAILEVVDAKVHFGGVKAVDGIDLRLEPGKLYGIVGPNGSGKTTLINAVSRITPLTAGAILFNGQDVTNAPSYELSRAGMARTFQAIRLLPTLTVRENVLLGVDSLMREEDGGGKPSSGWRSRGRLHAKASAAADEAIERLEITDVAGLLPDNLPYGTQRRVEIARAVASKPKLLLLDEPIAGMSRSERDEIAEVLRNLRDGGLTEILIEHDLRMVLETCDYLYVLNLGRGLAEGIPAETVALPEVQDAYLGRRTDEFA